jgi:hypothetical protein
MEPGDFRWRGMVAFPVERGPQLIDQILGYLVERFMLYAVLPFPIRFDERDGIPCWRTLGANVGSERNA